MAAVSASANASSIRVSVDRSTADRLDPTIRRADSMSVTRTLLPSRVRSRAATSAGAAPDVDTSSVTGASPPVCAAI